MTNRILNEEIEEQKKRSVLLVLTGPIGAGKDSVLNELQERDPSMIKIITTTSRNMRNSELEGDPYHFLSPEDFKKKISEEAFYEWMEFRNAMYGTQKETLEKALNSGNDVIWRVDIVGVKNMREKLKEIKKEVVFIFLTSPINVLEQRVKRIEGERGYSKRWVKELVLREIENYSCCDYLVFNEEGELDKTVDKIYAIMLAKRLEIKQ